MALAPATSESWLRIFVYFTIGFSSLLAFGQLGTSRREGLYMQGAVSYLVPMGGGGVGLYHQLWLGSLNVDKANLVIKSTLLSDKRSTDRDFLFSLY